MNIWRFGEGTVIRCGQCGRASVLGEGADVEAVEEYPGVALIEEEMAAPSCGHVDAHWVYASDQDDDDQGRYPPGCRAYSGYRWMSEDEWEQSIRT